MQRHMLPSSYDHQNSKSGLYVITNAALIEIQECTHSPHEAQLGQSVCGYLIYYPERFCEFEF